jgi:tetratricopeptide (TPR) repeat protein
LNLYKEAQSSFETALAFFRDPSADVNSAVAGDNVVHFRLASIQYRYAEEAEFRDADALERAMKHFKRSLLVAPTAEVWLQAGICAYRQACLGRQRSLFKCKEPAPEYQTADPEQLQKRQAGFNEASKYLTEANLLDVTRPQVNAWLVICAVEMGQVQVAKQTLRQALRYGQRLDLRTSLELAVTLLRFSDESRAGPGERRWLVQNGRYATEAIMVAELLAAAEQVHPNVFYILGRAYVLLGNDAAALPKLQEAVPFFNYDTPCQDEINEELRQCAQRLNANAGNVVGPVTVAAAPPRTAAQEAEFRDRLNEVRQGGSPDLGLADFANWESGFEVYDYDLPEILEAVFEGRICAVSLRSARLGSWGVREIVARLRESPGCLQQVDVSGCAAVGLLGQELVSSYPYKRGVSMEASDTGLPLEDVIKLRNAGEDSEKALRRAAAEQQRSANLCEEYLNRQSVLQLLGQEECNEFPAPDRPKASYYPSRWVEGIEMRAQQDYRNFVAANPMWGLVGTDWHDVTTEVATITARNGEVINLGFAGFSETFTISDPDVYTVLRQKKVDMLAEEGFVEFVGENREMDYAEDDAYMPTEQEPTMSKMPPPLYASIFGPSLQLVERSGAQPLNSALENRRLVGFMVYLGVRALPDEVAAAKEEREEVEAEEAERLELERQAQALRREMEERQRAEWERLHEDRVRGRNDLTTRSKIEYDGSSKKLPLGVSSGQIIAHFTYICLRLEASLGAALMPPSRFGLKMLREAPRPQPRRGHDLHHALFTGKVAIEQATGKSFGNGALQLKLRSLSSEPIEVAIRRGTIFQHSDWFHKQNLLVAIDYLLIIPAGGVEEKSMMAHCMNASCACSAGEAMELTEFYFDTSHILDSQGNVWDHFESCFGHR